MVTKCTCRICEAYKKVFTHPITIGYPCKFYAGIIAEKI